MSEYEKLVESLRSYSTEVISYKIDGTFAHAVTAAADAIEQLEADNESYKCAFADLHNEIANYCETIATLEKERDALMRDLKTYGSVCDICRERDSCYSKFSGIKPKCGAFDNEYWEWRGVQEEENGTEI